MAVPAVRAAGAGGGAPLREGRDLLSGSGGPVVYAASFGPFASFQLGWLYYVARATALAANANVFITYVAAFWPAVGGGLARALAILSLCGLLALVNVVGVRRAIRLLDVLTLLKAAPLVVMAIAGLAIAAEPLPSSLPPLAQDRGRGPAHILRVRRLRRAPRSSPGRRTSRACPSCC